MISPAVISPGLTDLSALFKTTIAPQAAQIDQDPQALHRAFQALGHLGVLGLKVPLVWGGQAWDATAIHHFTEQLARYSGTLAFLQSQHQRGVQEIAASENQALKQTYLQAAVRGDLGIGVGFSHLRRAQQPIMAEETTDGYRFNGTIPWLTGWGIFHHWMLAAQLPDGRAVFVLAPFAPMAGLAFSPPMALAAMGSSQTVTVTLTDWLAPKDLLLDIKPVGWIQACDRTRPLTHNFFALGCAQAGLDILQAAPGESFPAITDLYNQLNKDVSQCRVATVAAIENMAIERLPLRAEAIDLALRCAQAAVTVSRGAANVAHHPAQRVYREAMAFTVSGQTNDVMTATLRHLARRP